MGFCVGLRDRPESAGFSGPVFSLGGADAPQEVRRIAGRDANAAVDDVAPGVVMPPSRESRSAFAGRQNVPPRRTGPVIDHNGDAPRVSRPPVRGQVIDILV